jgi:hypothetical protein
MVDVDNLSSNIPSATFGLSNIWADLQYKGLDSTNSHIWRLNDYGENK